MYMFGDGGWHIGWMLLWWALPLALIVAVIWLATGRSSARGGRSASPEEVLKRRYATGEIDRDTYERMLEDLRK